MVPPMRMTFIDSAQLVPDDRIAWFLLKEKCDRLDRARGRIWHL